MGNFMFKMLHIYKKKAQVAQLVERNIEDV